MFEVVNPDGGVIFVCKTREEAQAFKASYDAHPVNLGRRLARVVEPNRAN